METKNELITYKSTALKAIFNKKNYPELNKWNRVEVRIAQEFIDYAEGNINWCDEDLDCFERKLPKSNPTYLSLVSLLIEYDYGFLTDEEVGVLWVASCCMLSQASDLGVADVFDKIPKNSCNEMFKKFDRDAVKKSKDRPSLKRGPKYNDYHTSYLQWLRRLHPWLKRNKKFKTNKSILVLVGLVLSASGFQELRGQYELLSPNRKYVNKNGDDKYVPVLLKEYIYGRMKTIFTYSPTLPPLRF